MKISGILIILGLISLVANAQGPTKSRLGKDEVISKHLASIGPTGNIVKHDSRVLVGESLMTSKGGGAVKLSGPAQLASVKDKFLLAMIFDVVQYPYEKVGFNGEDVTFGRHTGIESSLSFFLRANKAVLKRGLFGGTLNANWPMLKPDAAKYVDYAGVEKQNDRILHKLKYTASGLGNMSVTVFLEDNTFRHIRTEYRFTASGLMSYSPSGLSRSSTDSPDDYTLIESFDGFSKVGEITLPLFYNIEFVHKTAMRSFNWNVKFSQAYFNETLDADAFKVS